MVIFFNASVSGKREYLGHYQKIIAAIEHLGHSVVSPIAKGRSLKEIEQETPEAADTFYRTLRANISKARICLFEVSFPSTGIGHEISLALSMSKPVIALHIKERAPYILEAIPTEGLQVLEYSPEKLSETLADAIHTASEQMDTRFNFFISRRLTAYLDWISRTKRVPRAVYLRQLIRNEMRRHKDFR